DTGSMDLVWFQYSKWLKEQLPINKEVYIFGKINLGEGSHRYRKSRQVKQKDYPQNSMMIPAAWIWYGFSIQNG
ncbi:hypothetical protein BOQ64_23050, partial [Chryseobacterium sp. CH25]